MLTFNSPSARAEHDSAPWATLLRARAPAVVDRPPRDGRIDASRRVHEASAPNERRCLFPDCPATWRALVCGILFPQWPFALGRRSGDSGDFFRQSPALLRVCSLCWIGIAEHDRDSPSSWSRAEDGRCISVGADGALAACRVVIVLFHPYPAHQLGFGRTCSAELFCSLGSHRASRAGS